MKTYTLSQNGKDLGTVPEVSGGNWDRMWDTLTRFVKERGLKGRWYLYMHEVTEETDTWQNLKHFIEIN